MNKAQTTDEIGKLYQSIYRLIERNKDARARIYEWSIKSTQKGADLPMNIDEIFLSLQTEFNNFRLEMTREIATLSNEIKHLAENVETQLKFVQNLVIRKETTEEKTAEATYKAKANKLDAQTKLSIQVWQIIGAIIAGLIAILGAIVAGIKIAN